MFIRTRRLTFLLLLCAMAASARAANLDGSSKEVGDAEAARLYREANQIVSNMSEGAYSYAYLQFYWKRAQSDIDRARRVYPDSPTAVALAKGELKVGPYELNYFKDRVLYNLELKHLGAFDDVNCAIFLYGLDPQRSDAARDRALEDIIEVLSRRQRWGEAWRFPVLAVHRPLLLHTMFRIAAFYDQADEVRRLIADTTAADRKAAGFDALQAEAIALLGKPREDLYRYVDAHPTDEVRQAALRGIVERALMIRHAEAVHASFTDSIQAVHEVVQRTALRDDVPAVAARLFQADPSGSAPLLAIYSAGTGVAPAPGAEEKAHTAYLRFLADGGQLDAVASYPEAHRLRGATARACQLEAIELLAEAGRTGDADRLRTAYAAAGAQAANQAAYAEFVGQMDSTEAPLVAREKSFSSLPITDPCVMATAIMEWSLTPNRSQRGATPWDAVIARFAGGFENLPLPKSAVVGDAASTLKPY